jgi:predicted transcriptional regulator
MVSERIDSAVSNSKSTSDYDADGFLNSASYESMCVIGSTDARELGELCDKSTTLGG